MNRAKEQASSKIGCKP